MKNILKILFVLALLCNIGLADEFKSVQTLTLQKDEFKQYMVRYGTIEKQFYFRWTLYVNNGLVVLQAYDKFPAQYVLKLGYRNNTFKVYLTPKSTKLKTPYIMVKFLEFNAKENKAVFKLFLFDEEDIIKLEEIQEKER